MPYFIDRFSGDFGFMQDGSLVIVDESEQFTPADTEALSEMTDLDRIRYADAYARATYPETPTAWLERTEGVEQN